MQYIERLKSVPVKVRTFSFVKFHFALEKLLVRHFLHDITGCNALLVFLHNHQIAVWDFLQNLLAAPTGSRCLLALLCCQTYYVPR